MKRLRKHLKVVSEIIFLIFVLTVFVFSLYKVVNYVYSVKFAGAWAFSWEIPLPPPPPPPPEPPCPPPYPPTCPSPSPSPSPPPSPSPEPSPLPSPSPSPSVEPSPSPEPSPSEPPVGGDDSGEPTEEVLGVAEGEVLGVTTLADTGSLMDDLFQILFIIGSVCLSLGLREHSRSVLKI